MAESIRETSRLVVVTGAGISAESGIPTFRDADGLWARHRVEDVATPEGFAADPAYVWAFYQQRRASLRDANPNPAHLALVRLEQAMGDRFLLVTQNVDGLHLRAGSERVIEIHGSLSRDRCVRCDHRDGSARLYTPEELAATAGVPPCPFCGASLRPDVVWFGESLRGTHLAEVDRWLDEADWFLAVGTSGHVYPVSEFVYRAHGRRIYVGVERPANATAFDEIHLGRAGELLPPLVERWLGRDP